MAGAVVVLAGGTGGAKLARGLLDVVGDELVVVANTGDDLEIYGSYVAPDPDLVAYWLADRIDARGWGVRGDTFAVMDALRELGEEVWFNLGDRDLAFCVARTRRLAEGLTLTAALAEQTAALGLGARVLPMADGPVRTRVRVDGDWLSLQEFLIRRRGAGPVQDVDYYGVDGAVPTAAVLEAVAGARAIVVGPSNPVISIGPILAVPGMLEALATAAAPVVAVSPFVAGEIVKGPTAAFLEWAGVAPRPAGVVELYGELLDGFVADERLDPAPVPTLVSGVDLGTPAARASVAVEVLRFAEALA